MKLGDKVKKLLQREASPETEEERAARAKAEGERDGPQIPPF